MTKITLIAVGRMKQGAFADLQTHYTKRMPGMVQIIEVAEAPGQGQTRMKAEADSLMAKIKPRYPVYLLDKDGKTYDSQAFASLVQRAGQEAGHLQLIIGGAEGLSNSLKDQYPALSFGKATWPHQLVRVMLLEQIYRAHCINNRHPYHK